MDIELTLNARYACEGGAITFTSAVYHAGELPLARFNVEHDQEQRHEVEMVVGDVVAIGNTVFVLTAVTSHDAPVRFNIRQLIVRPVQEQALGISFKLCLGAPTALPAGRQVELIAISHHGVVLLLRETNGIKRKHICALGFLREDGLLFEILDEEREAGTVELLVQLEDVANHPVVMSDGAPVSIGVRDIATRADGLQIKLRSAQRYSHDAIGWNFIASIGNGIRYPYISQHKKQSKASANTFMLYARQHTLTMIHATLTPSPLLTLSVSTAKLESFSLRESFELKVGVPRSGPDGLLLLFQRSSHGHGTRMGAGGNKVSMTSAWADFEIVKNAQREGFRVDLMATDRSGTQQRLGYVITVETINPGRAVLRVDGDLSLDMG